MMCCFVTNDAKRRCPHFRTQRRAPRTRSALRSTENDSFTLVRLLLYGRMHRHLLALLFLTVTACGLTTTQRAAVRNFSQATAALGEATSGQFVQMRDDVIRMNTARSELAAPGPHEGALDGPFAFKDVVVRTQAASALREYGELLQALVDDTQEKELQTASDNFVASVRGLPGTEKKLSDNQLNGIGQAVREVGSLVVEWKKKQAIEHIVPEADPQVAALCDLLAADLDPDGNRLATGYLNAASRLRTASDSSVKGSSNPTTRAAAAAAYQFAETSRARRDVLERASAAATKLKAANKALTTAIASNEVTSDDLKSYAATVQSLIETIKVLH